jgi:pyridoxine/pyridoxamine 5'-phosphate oxidase
MEQSRHRTRNGHLGHRTSQRSRAVGRADAVKEHVAELVREFREQRLLPPPALKRSLELN